MVGCYRISGRVKSIPPEGVDFIASCFQSIQSVVLDCRACIPTRIKSPTQLLTKSTAMAAKVGYIGVVPTKKWMNKHVFKSLNISTITEPELYDAVNRVMELVSTPLINIVTREGIKNADVDNIKVKDIVSCRQK